MKVATSVSSRCRWRITRSSARSAWTRRYGVGPLRYPNAGRYAHVHRDGVEVAGGRAALPFATIEQAIGPRRRQHPLRQHRPRNRRVEIGWTWIGATWQRTAVNTEAKYLMLRHAFETLGCIRVELKTDVLNQRSRAAILRLGAKEEGTLRNHMISAGRPHSRHGLLQHHRPRMAGSQSRAGRETGTPIRRMRDEGGRMQHDDLAAPISAIQNPQCQNPIKV